MDKRGVSRDRTVKGRANEHVYTSTSVEILLNNIMSGIFDIATELILIDRSRPNIYD